MPLFFRKSPGAIRGRALAYSREAGGDIFRAEFFANAASASGNIDLSGSASAAVQIGASALGGLTLSGSAQASVGTPGSFVWLGNTLSAAPSISGAPASATYLNASETSYVTRGGLTMRVFLSSAFASDSIFGGAPAMLFANNLSGVDFQIAAGSYEVGLLFITDGLSGGTIQVRDDPAGANNIRYSYTVPTSNPLRMLDTDGTAYTAASTAASDAIAALTYVPVTVSDLGGGVGRLYISGGSPGVLVSAIAIRAPTAAAGLTATAAGSLSLVGSAAATVRAAGSASGSLSLAGSAVAVTAVSGGAAGSLALAGSAATAVAVSGSASGVLPLSGSAAAQTVQAIIGQAAGSLALSGSAAATVRAQASATGALALSGASLAAIAVAGTGTGALALTGAATARVAIAGACSGIISLGGSAEAFVPVSPTLVFGVEREQTVFVVPRDLDAIFAVRPEQTVFAIPREPTVFAVPREQTIFTIEREAA